MLGFILCVMSIYGGGLILAKSSDSNEQATLEQNSKSKLSGDALYTKNRDKVILCIDNYSTSFEVNDIEKLVKKTSDVLINSIKKHKDWKQIGASQYEIEVKSGCSFNSFLADINNAHPIYTGKNNIRVVDEASVEQIALFVVDQQVIDKNFRDTPSRWGPEEYLCEENECVEVTSGIYINADEAKDIKSSKLIDELKFRFGLDKQLIQVSADEEIEKSKKNK